MKKIFTQSYKSTHQFFSIVFIILAAFSSYNPIVVAQKTPSFGGGGGFSGGGGGADWGRNSSGSGGPGRTSSADSCPASFISPPANFKEFVCLVGRILNSLLPIVVAMTLLAFFWGLAQSIRNAGNPKEIQKGKDIMKWGIIGLFVMISFVGIINLFTSDFFGSGVKYGIPQFPENTQST